MKCAGFRGLFTRYMGGFPKLVVLFGGPYNEDYSIMGSIFVSPSLRKLPHPRFGLESFMSMQHSVSQNHSSKHVHCTAMLT